MQGPIEAGGEFEERWQDWGRRVGRLGSGAGWLIVLLIVAIWLLSGIYTVGPSEVALVKQFGKYTQANGPGFHYRLPWPMESVVIVDSQSVRTEEIGFQSRPGVPSTEFPTK